MTSRSIADEIRTALANLEPAKAVYATEFVRILLDAAERLHVSDVHLQPTADGLDVRWRLDGVLQPLGVFPFGQSTDVVSRLKVLAELLTYRRDVPQEGRIRERMGVAEIRVSTFPTLHGERAVVRLFAERGSLLHLDDLGFPGDIKDELEELLWETSGAILVTGPAGTGKTTTAYACLRELVRRSQGGKSILSLEDPVEVAVDGVVQSQVNPSAGFTLATGLRSLMRQDPEAIMVGEIRDRETAEGVFQGALTGHLVITTFHAGSAAGAISRLSDMGIEPYLLRSGILGIVCQRLLRRLCTCAQEAADESARLGLPVDRVRQPAGCDACSQTGYQGRMLVAELLRAEPTELGRAILSRSDAPQLEKLAIDNGMVPLWQRACNAVATGQTSAEEVRRVLGFVDSRSSNSP